MADLETYTDEELLRRYRKTEDNRWLGMALEKYTMLLFGVAMKYLRDREVSADAVQQVFLKAITHLPPGEIGNFKGWLYVLMRNHCLQLLRDKHYKAPEETLQSVADIPAADWKTLEEYDHTLDQVTDALRELNREQRVCVSLFYLSRKTYSEIMAQTGYTFAQVKTYIQNGKRNLRIILLKKSGRQPL